MCACVIACVRARERESVCVCVCVSVCVVSVFVKRPVLPPCAVDGRSRNSLYYNYYYKEPEAFDEPTNTGIQRGV